MYRPLRSLLLSGLVLLAILLGLGLWHGGAQVAAGPAETTSYKIETRQAGLYQVTYADLAAAGFDPTGIPTSTFQLFNFDEELAILLYDGGDDSFDPGDYFLFYAEARRTRYTTHNIYWFVAGQNSRQLPQVVDGTPGAAPLAAHFWRSVYFEQDLVYRSELPLTGDDADRWYWRFWQACPPGSRTCNDAFGARNARSFPFSLAAVSSSAHDAELKVVLRGASNELINPDKHVLFSINDTQVGNVHFDGMALHTAVATFDAALLNNGANTFKIDVPDDLGNGTGNQGYLNSYQLSFRSDFMAQADALAFGGDEAGTWKFGLDGFTNPDIVIVDVTNPKQPRLIQSAAIGALSAAGTAASATFEADNGSGGAQYYAASAAGWHSPYGIQANIPTQWKSPGHGADYIIISHADFLGPSQTLADYRTAANGFRTVVIDVQDIYDEFNGGLMAAEAIRDFVRYATHYWQPPRPQYIVLMGNGHYDYLNILGSNVPIFVPSYLAAVDPFQGETAADNRYVDVLGNEQYDSDADATHTIRDIEVKLGRMALWADFGYVPPGGGLAAAGAAEAEARTAGPARTGSPASPDRVALVKAIGDMVFWDENLNGLWDADERGVPGATVHLWRDGAIVDTQITDVGGKYFFEDIPTGVYQVQFVPPAGWQFTTQYAGTDVRYDSNADPATGFSESISYTYPQTAIATIDAGIVRPGTIGNFVWEDVNGNGLQDAGEPGIPGVALDLIQNGSVVASTTSGADGYYFFYDLPDGVYDVQVSAANFASGGALEGYDLSPWDQGLDGMPDLKLGRFPVLDLAQAEEMVNRAINYETNSPLGDWRKRVLFVADNPDPAGDFYEHSNAVANHIWPFAEGVVKAYYLQTHGTATAMRTAIIDGINQGALFVTYNGHSSKRTWGDNFFDRDNINLLGNTIFPIFLPMTCLEGQFINPGFASMGEQAVRTIGKGAVASFSPTGLGVATGHQFLYKAFFEALASGETRELGELTVIAKQALFQSHSLFKDLLDDYILLGDPALQVQMAAADVAVSKTVTPEGEVTPGSTITYTLTYANAGSLLATDVVLTDTLPAGLLNPVATSQPPVSAEPGATYVWSLGDLDPGAGGVITITATVDPGLATPATLVNTAIISASNEDFPGASNSSAVSTGVVDFVGDPAQMGGVTWLDANGNGVLEGGETGRVPGVPITATLVGGGGTFFTTTSNGEGVWSLTGLPAGTYVVTASPVFGLVATTPLNADVTLLSGASNQDVHFGYITPTAVNLVQFQAERHAQGVLVQWQTSREQHNTGFYVYRSNSPVAHGKRISDLIPGAGLAEGQRYSFLDAGVEGNGWYYWLEALDDSGASEFFGPVSVPEPGDGGGRRVFLGLILRP